MVMNTENFWWHARLWQTVRVWLINATRKAKRELPPDAKLRFGHFEIVDGDGSVDVTDETP